MGIRIDTIQNSSSSLMVVSGNIPLPAVVDYSFMSLLSSVENKGSLVIKFGNDTVPLDIDNPFIECLITQIEETDDGFSVSQNGCVATLNLKPSLHPIGEKGSFSVKVSGKIKYVGAPYPNNQDQSCVFFGQDVSGNGHFSIDGTYEIIA